MARLWSKPPLTFTHRLKHAPAGDDEMRKVGESGVHNISAGDRRVDYVMCEIIEDNAVGR